MPITQNGYYNNPAMGQAFSSIASLFAPPTVQEQAAAAQLLASKAKEARLADLYSQAKDPNFNQSTFDRGNIAAGNYAPTQGYQQIDTTRRTALDTNTADNQNKVIVQGLQNQQSGTNNALDNSTKVQVANINEAGNTARAFVSPIPTGGVRALPPSMAQAYGVPTLQPGVIDADQGHTLTLPTGRVISGGEKPISSTDLAANIVQGLSPEEQKKWALSQGKGVSVNVGAEKAEEQGRGAGLAKNLNSIVDEGNDAAESGALLDRLGDLAHNVDPGARTAALEAIRAKTGIALDPNTDNVQAFNAAVQRIAPLLRVKGSGAQSDRELGNFLSSVPGLLGTPGGNDKVLATLQGMNAYKMQRAQIAQDWQLGNISPNEAHQRLAALPSPFAAAAAPPAGGAQPAAAPATPAAQPAPAGRTRAQTGLPAPRAGAGGTTRLRWNPATGSME